MAGDIDGQDVARQVRQALVDLRDALVASLDAAAAVLDELLVEPDGGDFPTAGDFDQPELLPPTLADLFEVDETSVSIQDPPIPDPNPNGYPEADCPIGSSRAHDPHVWQGSHADHIGKGPNFFCPGMPF